MFHFSRMTGRPHFWIIQIVALFGHKQPRELALGRKKLPGCIPLTSMTVATVTTLEVPVQ